MNLGRVLASADMPEPEFFIVLFVTGGIFAGGALLTFVAVWWLWRHQRSKILIGISLLPLVGGAIIFAPFFCLLLSWIVYWVLPQHQTTHAEVVRLYHGSIRGADETLLLKADDRFEQTIKAPDGRVYEQQGQWKLHGNYVELSKYLEMFDTEHDRLFAEPQLIWGMEYRYYYGDKFLVWDWDADHYILKGQ